MVLNKIRILFPVSTIMQMAKSFKYQKLMKEKGVTHPCPFLNCKEEDIKVFHFGFEKVEDQQNFRPGHLRATQRINDVNGPTNCAYCALSMFKTEDGARKKWWKELQPRHRELLKYTHLLVGELKKELGVMSIESGDHFSFFEYEGVNLHGHFKVNNAL